MTFRAGLLCAAAITSLAAFAVAAPAQALTMQECSAKYKAAKDAGTLNGQKWNDFRKAQCAADATPAATTAAPAAPAAPPPATAEAKPKKEAAPMAAPSGPAIFPNAVDPKYAKETAAKQRFNTCVDQYNANKAGSGNGGLKWIEKGGGYWSGCDKALKGSTRPLRSDRSALKVKRPSAELPAGVCFAFGAVRARPSGP